MEEKTNQTQSAVFNYTAPRAVRMGDVFYRVESGESVYFREPCKVCDGTGQLTVRGVTFKCPCCDAQKEVIGIHKYVVRRYRVYKIAQEAGTSEWKPCDYKDITFSLYRKVGHGFCVYGGGGHIEFTDRKFAQNYNLPLNGNMARGERGMPSITRNTERRTRRCSKQKTTRNQIDGGGGYGKHRKAQTVVRTIDRYIPKEKCGLRQLVRRYFCRSRYYIGNYPHCGQV